MSELKPNRYEFGYSQFDTSADDIRILLLPRESYLKRITIPDLMSLKGS
ncbi:MAG: hypothetical protein IPJ13_00960 [Saprospiraceae bacterium]|nr:hypothetical protein [Saprospiraceae bacterium]